MVGDVAVRNVTDYVVRAAIEDDQLVLILTQNVIAVAQGIGNDIAKHSRLIDHGAALAWIGHVQQKANGLGLIHRGIGRNGQRNGGGSAGAGERRGVNPDLDGGRRDA